ncbi:hypothetical protein RG077_003716 [Proteus mirabilis]|uniref:hypothetical protein n=1 Tax=Klebsiella pneumoniae TaxID=573 RepID=UPI002175E373|nr:hypothetical protein [Klebsiella pneumoniae]ELA9962549.1 hypothetical protein [Proteus mirabilis]
MSTAHKKASLLQKVSKGLTVGSVITGSTFLHGPPVLALGFTKLFKKSKKVDETNIRGRLRKRKIKHAKPVAAVAMA